MDWVSQIDAWLEGSGPLLLPILALASLIEYVFPPFPGDTITVFGSYLAVRGEVSPWAVLAVTTLGSLAGGWMDYHFGVWLQHRIEHPHGERWRRTFSPERLAPLEAKYRKWGPWLILANRFVPVSRAVFFVFAGMSGIPLRRTLLLGTASAVAWNGMLIAFGYSVGANLELLREVVGRYSRAAMGLAVLVAIPFVAVWLWRWWRARRG
jgi:membrane protein DedA with SNARE-associated domain